MKKIYSAMVMVIMAIVMLIHPTKSFASIPGLYGKEGVAEVTQKMDWLANEYEGSYFTTSKEKVYGSTYDSKLDSIIGAKWFKDRYGNLNVSKFPGTAQSPYGYSLCTGSCWSCLGFSRFAMYYVFDSLVASNASSVVAVNGSMTYDWLSSNAYPGDVIRFEGQQYGSDFWWSHSAMVYSVDSDGITVIDSNSNGNNQISKHKYYYINWRPNTTVSVTRMDEYHPNQEIVPDYTLHMDEYICVSLPEKYADTTPLTFGVVSYERGKVWPLSIGHTWIGDLYIEVLPCRNHSYSVKSLGHTVCNTCGLEVEDEYIFYDKLKKVKTNVQTTIYEQYSSESKALEAIKKNKTLYVDSEFTNIKGEKYYHLTPDGDNKLGFGFISANDVTVVNETISIVNEPKQLGNSDAGAGTTIGKQAITNITVYAYEVPISEGVVYDMSLVPSGASISSVNTTHYTGMSSTPNGATNVVETQKASYTYWHYHNNYYSGGNGIDSVPADNCFDYCQVTTDAPLVNFNVMNDYGAGCQVTVHGGLGTENDSLAYCKYNYHFWFLQSVNTSVTYDYDITEYKYVIYETMESTNAPSNAINVRMK